MAAPLSGVIGSQQQAIPAAQATQPAVTDPARQVRQPEQTPDENAIQPRDAAAGQTQETTLSAEDFREQLTQISNSNDENAAPARGSNLDVTA